MAIGKVGRERGKAGEQTGLPGEGVALRMLQWEEFLCVLSHCDLAAERQELTNGSWYCSSHVSEIHINGTRFRKSAGRDETEMLGERGHSIAHEREREACSHAHRDGLSDERTLKHTRKRQQHI
eukprot:5778010-Pleurochrysis_carterae.AAC.2